MIASTFPTSQRELLLAARGTATQTAFAAQLGIDRTCLSRYESEKLGAPTHVLNFCLKSLAARWQSGSLGSSPVEVALTHARRAVDTLEQAAKSHARAGPKPHARPPKRITRRR